MMERRSVHSIDLPLLDRRVVLACGLAYLVNRFVIKTAVHWTFTDCHFNDFVAGVGFAPLCNTAFRFFRLRIAIRTPLPIAFATVYAGIVWEYVAPLYVQGSISDVFDLVAYAAGGSVYAAFIGAAARRIRIANSRLGRVVT